MIVTLPQYEEYLCRYDIEECRQGWKLIRVGDLEGEIDQIKKWAKVE